MRPGSRLQYLDALGIDTWVPRAAQAVPARARQRAGFSGAP
jgi:hypothetical protein